MTLIKLFIKNFERVEKNAEGTSAGPRSQPRPCGAPRLPPVRVSGRLPPHAPALGQSFPRGRLLIYLLVPISASITPPERRLQTLSSSAALWVPGPRLVRAAARLSRRRRAGPGGAAGSCGLWTAVGSCDLSLGRCLWSVDQGWASPQGLQAHAQEVKPAAAPRRSRAGWSWLCRQQARGPESTGCRGDRHGGGRDQGLDPGGGGAGAASACACICVRVTAQRRSECRISVHSSTWPGREGPQPCFTLADRVTRA